MKKWYILLHSMNILANFSIIYLSYFYFFENSIGNVSKLIRKFKVYCLFTSIHTVKQINVYLFIV